MTLIMSTNVISPHVFNVSMDEHNEGKYEITMELYPLTLADIPRNERLFYRDLIIDKIRSIHNLGIYHGDIHEENIVIRGNDVRIIDYGTTRFISDIDNLDFYETAEGLIPSSIEELLRLELEDVYFITA
jgi:tRNA A-37 threonylcarbamoyl transferase component Bud32